MEMHDERRRTFGVFLKNVGCGFDCGRPPRPYSVSISLTEPLEDEF